MSNCVKPIEPTQMTHGWRDVYAPPREGFAERSRALHERLEHSWFSSTWRERLDDGCRMKGKEARTWRGIRLYAYWWFAVPRDSKTKSKGKR